MRTRSIPVHQIFLDPLNPRHEAIDNEQEILAYLLAREKIKSLARDISERGLSPLERTAVIPHDRVPNAFIIVEGNRRLAALKLLRDPKRAPTRVQEYFTKLKADASVQPPKELEVVVFPSRDAARGWLKLRHDGEQDGVGTKSWRAVQKARFNKKNDGRSDSPNALAHDVIEYAAVNDLIDDQDRGSISLTTLTRYLSNPVVRTTLGLSHPKELRILVPESEFRPVLKQFLTDAVSGVVNSRSTKDDRVAYAVKLGKSSVAPRSQLDAEIKLDSSQKTVPSGSRGSRRQMSPDKRRNVVPRDFETKTEDRTLRRMLDELRSIDADTLSFAAAYLLRGVTEVAMKVFLKSHGMAWQAEDEHVLAKRCADHLVSLGEKEVSVKTLRVLASSKHDRVSLHTIGHWVHGGEVPTRAEINRRWESLQPSVDLLLRRAKTKSGQNKIAKAESRASA